MKRATAVIFLGLATGAGPALWAQDSVPVQDFTFRRVKAPPPGQTGRIDVQIDPEEQARRLATPWPEPELSAADTDDAAVAALPDGGSYPWFWARVSPELKDSRPGRLEQAIAALSLDASGNGVATPKLQDVQDIADRFGKDILLATVGTRVSPALVLAVIMVESGGREQALSEAGAQGLMQLIPATADRFDVADANIAGDNIRGGVAYLDWLMDEFQGDPVMVLAAYNAGENAVRKHEGVPPFTETRDYVPRVLAAWTIARGLCLTRPELMSDGCVFAKREAGLNE